MIGRYLRDKITGSIAKGNTGAYLWNVWKVTLFETRNPYSLFHSRSLMPVVIGIIDQLTLYQSQVSQACGATPLACKNACYLLWQLLHVPQGSQKRKKSRDDISILQED
jgi:hypothetical protein